MNSLAFRAAALGALVLAAVPASARAATLVSDTFADNDRTTQSLPSSMAWYALGGGTTTAGSGALTYTSAGSTVNLVSYFTGSGSPYALQAGETMTLSLSLTLSSVVDSATSVRFGLFNSGGSRVSADVSPGFQSASFSTYAGYSVWFDPAATASTDEIMSRSGSNTAIFAAGNSAVVGTAATPSVGMGANVPALLQLQITRTASGLFLQSSVNGVVESATDLSAANFSFDTLALQFSGTVPGSGNTAVLDNVSVTVVPEPSALALLSAGMAGLGWIVARKRAEAAGA